MRSSFDPLGSTALIIDKLIGNAYSIVEYVAKNMTHVRRASFYMKNIYDASQRLTKLVPFTSPAIAGASVDVPLPNIILESEEGVTSTATLLLTNVVGWRVLLEGADGIIYAADSAMWTVQLHPVTGFHVTLADSAPPNFLGRPMKLLVDFTV
jgi:hypothetical protein